MPNFKNFQSSQDQAGQQVTPVAYRWLAEADIGNASKPGQWSPITLSPAGEIMVRMQSIAGNVLNLEDTPATIPSSLTDEVVPVNSRLYAWDGGNFSRLETRPDDDLAEEALGDEMLEVSSNNYLFNDSLGEWRVDRGNQTPFPTIAPLASRSATTTFDFEENNQFAYAHFVINVTVIGVDTLTVEINGYDPEGLSATYNILVSPTINATGLTVLKIGPGFNAVANLTANDVVPFDYQVRAVHSGADPITYSIGVQWVRT